MLNCLSFFHMFSSFSFIFSGVLICFSLFCHSSFAWVLTLALLGCSFLLRFIFLGEGLVQMAFLSSQGAPFWCLHVVFRNTAAGFLSSPLSSPRPLCLTSSAFHLYCPCSVPILVPVPGGSPDFRALCWEGALTFASARGLHRRAQGLVWSGVTSTPAVLAAVLSVAPALSHECLLVISQDESKAL